MKKAALVVLAVLSLSACDTMIPSHMETGSIRVKEDMAVEEVSADDTVKIAAVAERYRRTAQGGMKITASWLSSDPASRTDAERSLDKLNAAFIAKGLPRSALASVAVEDAKDAGKMIVSYPALAALPPKGCAPVTGDRVADVDAYSFGCDTKAAMSKMVSDPSDFLGKKAAGEEDSRRSGAAVDNHKSGKPNAPLKGYTASDVGSGG